MTDGGGLAQVATNLLHFIQMPAAKAISHRMIWIGALLLTISLQAAPKNPPAYDPGVRARKDAAGGPLPGISTDFNKLFTAGQAKFLQVDQVLQDGLGPRMN